jgi:hypothetical protein
MAEQEQVETTSSEAADETFDDVFKQFPVEDTASSFTAQPKNEEPPEVNIPDPSYDLDGFKTSMKSLTKNDWEVKQALNRVSEQLNGLQQAQQRTIEEEDINSTIGTIQDSIPSLKGKDRLVKGYLGAVANEDNRIARAWESRKKNPAAWEKTLSVITKQMAKDFDFAADPQLTENTRAAKASRDQMATTRASDPDDKWTNASPQEFQHYWSQLTNS